MSMTCSFTKYDTPLQVFFSVFYQFKFWDGFYIMGTLPGKRFMVFVPDLLKHQKRTITIWIIIGSSHRRCSGKNGVLKGSCSESGHVKFAVRSLEKIHSIIFGKFEDFQRTTLLKMNFFKVLFKNFDCKFQNTYFAEQVSVIASELYRFIKPIHMQIQFFFEEDLLTRCLKKTMFFQFFLICYIPEVKDIFNREISTILQSKFPNIAVYLA